MHVLSTESNNREGLRQRVCYEAPRVEELRLRGKLGSQGRQTARGDVREPRPRALNRARAS